MKKRLFAIVVPYVIILVATQTGAADGKHFSWLLPILPAMADSATEVVVKQGDYVFRSDPTGAFSFEKSSPIESAVTASAPIVTGSSTSTQDDSGTIRFSFTTTLQDGTTSDHLVLITPTVEQERYPFTDYPCTYEVNLVENSTGFSLVALVDACRGLVPRGMEITGSSSLESISSEHSEVLRKLVKKLGDKAGNFKFRLPNPDKSGFNQNQPYYGGQFYSVHLAQEICMATCAVAIELGILCSLTGLPQICLPAVIAGAACLACQLNLLEAQLTASAVSTRTPAVRIADHRRSDHIN